MKIKSLLKVVVVIVVVAFVVLFAIAKWWHGGPQPGTVLDEARAANRAPDSFHAADEDYFHDMDSPVALTPDEVKGRNTWLVWTGGNDRFWDGLSATTGGAVDLLKTISSHPSLRFSRD